MSWPLAEQYLLFKKLQLQMQRQECPLQDCLEKANDVERIKLLLKWKKEAAIVELNKLLPYVDLRKEGSVLVYLRILPIFLSYVTLYDMEWDTAVNIVQIIRSHPAFNNYGRTLCTQWMVVFQRRVMSKRPFSYKDESCVRDLPKLSEECQGWIGYSDVGLFRAFHRWLRLLRLHKYLFLFVSLTYEEILLMDKEKLDMYEATLNLGQITLGAKTKLLKEIERLRNRRSCLEDIVHTQKLITSNEIEKAIRDVKRILRTPISTDDELREEIPRWLVTSLHAIFCAMRTNLSVHETSVPVYGLFISLLKEAWNYNIFMAEEKNFFNEWRASLSEKMRTWSVEGLSWCGIGNDTKSSPVSLARPAEAPIPTSAESVQSLYNDSAVRGPVVASPNFQYDAAAFESVIQDPHAGNVSDLLGQLDFHQCLYSLDNLN